MYDLAVIGGGPGGYVAAIRGAQKGRKVLLMRRKNNELMAISTECTHLGCSVYYRPGKRIFDCPCHQGVFDFEGNPISGPPTRPLERYPVEVRESKIFVHFS